MAKVRVYLATFRRHELLPRALKSLESQTFKDWICEVHNDEPNDRFPNELVAKIADPRISILNHLQNLGGAATLNAFYAPAKEEFFSILEDDNWWEPNFLEEMLKVSERHPEIAIFWANMKIWHEEKNGKFAHRGETIHAQNDKEPYAKIEWGDERQIMGAVHSGGACFIRSGNGANYRIPSVPCAAIENFRERCFPHPLLLVRKPLANFSVTLKSERSNDQIVAWGEAQAVLTATFFSAAPWSKEMIREYFIQGRKKNPPATGVLLSAALFEPKIRFLFRTASCWELAKWLLGFLKRPKMIGRLLSSRKLRGEWWRFLSLHTRERFAEAELRKTEI